MMPPNRGPARGARIPGAKLDMRSARRLLSYLGGRHKAALAVVLVCILFSAVAGVAGSLFLEILIDDYISPLLAVANPSFGGLLRAILTMAAIYLAGVLSTYLYNRLMVVVAQGVLKEIRDEMFSKMQELPIRYFDTHTHGDIMSHYTNDTDTLRQMISQSIPQVFSSIVTIVTVFFAMLFSNLVLTALVLLCVGVMLLVSRFISGRSGSFFIKQQEALGDVNGYIEEMINGQKVVKVFCHEEAAEADFDRRNDELCRQATAANVFANILMPINANLGNLQYVLIAVIGGALGISGVGGITLGAIASFLQLSRSFSQPISQVSQQINSIVMALAGAKRIFQLMDEEPEQDSGYVTLVNAREEQGEIVETAERTGFWAWKHPHGDGRITYTPLRGEVRFFDVDFGYEDGKLVLHDITLYAQPGQKVAFVGATGAGKTTITNLINRFYDIADGKIRYDGININKIRKSDLRRSLGIVPLYRHRDGKHPVRPAGCHRRGGVRGRPSGGGGRFHPPSAGGLRHPPGWGRRPPLPRAAAAIVHRPGRRGRSAGDDSGRGHLLHRHPHRGHRAAGDGRADEGPHGLCHRPPAFHRAECRRDHGPGAGPDH